MQVLLPNEEEIVRTTDTLKEANRKIAGLVQFLHKGGSRNAEDPLDKQLSAKKKAFERGLDGLLQGFEVQAAELARVLLEPLPRTFQASSLQLFQFSTADRHPEIALQGAVATKASKCQKG